MKLAHAKCAAFSLVPSEKTKKIKVITDPQFTAGGREVPQLSVLQTVRYLGVRFAVTGPVIQGIEMLPLLERIIRAPLKPQQGLKILRTYLIPRFTHSLVLGHTSYSLLRKLDRQVRAAVRRWLRLPNDIPGAFFHSPIKQGGLGILSFETTIPRLTLARLEQLKTSQYKVVWLALVFGLTEGCAGVGSLGSAMRIDLLYSIIRSMGSSHEKRRILQLLRAGWMISWSISHLQTGSNILKYG